MKKLKTLAIFLLTFIITIPQALAQNEGRIVGLDENVKAYLIGNQETGEVYYEKNSDIAYPMASLTKLMTFLLTREAIDRGDLSLDTYIKADERSQELTSWEYSSLGLKEGEEYKVDDLLKGLIAVSGNDCAYLLGKTIGGSEEEFAQMMNQKASELDLASQVYYNASGIETDDGKENQSSAKDLFTLASIIVRTYPDILEYSSMDEVVIEEKGIKKESTIPLRGEIPGLDGLKTGTTENAGYCLVSTVDMSKIDPEDNFRTIGVVMGADQADTRNLVMSDLIYYISRYFSYEDILNTNESVKTLDLISAKQGYVDLYPAEDISIVSKDSKIVSKKIYLNEPIKAPIAKGDILGRVDVSYDDQAYQVDLLAKSDVKEASKFGKIMRTLEENINFLIDLLIAR
ncbi:MAG: D-alanyl-D-alanine carboxypeptidase family protein [Anaerococcus sp.]|nr:D-alanyl-D-alanine carboxypeptidase family protein [Anaerococcus sp.]